MEDETWVKQQPAKVDEPTSKQEEFVVAQKCIELRHHSTEEKAYHEESSSGASRSPRWATRGVVQARLNDCIFGLAATDCG